MKLLHGAALALLHQLHLAIIVFCLVGWLWPATRPAHLALCLLILGSWFVLGAFKGWGYCLVTDLQWRLQRRMGRPVPATGYMPVLWQALTGRAGDPRRIEWLTQAVFYACFLASLVGTTAAG